MFIKDPNSKVSYSFRIKPDLLENLKLYSEAVGQSLPETLNILLEDSIKGFNLSNTYLTDMEGAIINVPFMYTEVNDIFGEYTDEIIRTEYYLHKGTINYLDFDTEGLTYEVRQIPNNLDIWNDKMGYYSNNGYKHEGVSYIIIPELILNDNLIITERAISNCLKFIYFRVYHNGNLEVENISYKDCFRRLKEAGNEEILYKFKDIDKTIYKFSLSFIDKYNISVSDYLNEDYKNLKLELYHQLLGYALKYNDSNIISLESTNLIEPPAIPEFLDDNQTVLNNSDNIINQLMEENKALKDKVNEFETRQKELEETILSNIGIDRLKKLNELIDDLENKRDPDFKTDEFF